MPSGTKTAFEHPSGSRQLLRAASVLRSRNVTTFFAIVGYPFWTYRAKAGASYLFPLLT